MAYAEDTKVPVTQSLGEINRMLKKAGADRIGQAEEPGRLAIQCFLNERLLRFAVELPTEGTITMPRGGRLTIKEQIAKRSRQRARALLLVIKAKLESWESGVETFEEAFLANVVMPDGKTVAEHALPAIAHGYATGTAPPLMLGCS